MSGGLRAPFPYFGGKSRVADVIWRRFGTVQNYVEPFFGSGAVLLASDKSGRTETINDADGYVSNFWRAIQADPAAVAKWANWPVNEDDLQARHYWLITKGRDRLTVLGNPDGYDAQVAGWWVWGLCSWIGSGWCSGEGPWQWTGEEWIKRSGGEGINRKLPHLGNAGRGINRQLPHLGDAGRGINRITGAAILDQFTALADRMRGVRVAHGDWSRVCKSSVTWQHGLTAVFLDPPYGGDRCENLYATDSMDVAAKVREWAVDAGQRPDMRICLAGYADEHDLPGWSQYAWKAKGGFGNQSTGRGRDNASRETLWFSPACLSQDNPHLI